MGVTNALNAGRHLRSIRQAASAQRALTIFKKIGEMKYHEIREWFPFPPEGASQVIYKRDWGFPVVIGAILLAVIIGVWLGNAQ